MKVAGSRQHQPQEPSEDQGEACAGTEADGHRDQDVAPRAPAHRHAGDRDVDRRRPEKSTGANCRTSA